MKYATTAKITAAAMPPITTGGFATLFSMVVPECILKYPVVESALPKKYAVIKTSVPPIRQRLGWVLH